MQQHVPRLACLYAQHLAMGSSHMCMCPPDGCLYTQHLAMGSSHMYMYMCMCPPDAPPCLHSDVDEQPVILARVFPSAGTAGYTNLADRQVMSVNGHEVRNLAQMYALVQELHKAAESIVFEVHCTGGNALVVTSTAAADKMLQNTLKLYRIPAAASPELIDEGGHSS
jgi:hypothetical protein